MSKVYRNFETKQTIVGNIDKALAAGGNVADAAKAEGITPSSYYSWRAEAKRTNPFVGKDAKKLKAMTTAPTVVTLPNFTNRLVVLIGDANEIKTTLDRLAGMNPQ